jgi:sugar phosphate isomerase/epimerase
VKAARVRIAVSSRSFRRPLAAAELSQLEWVERCASELGADGVLPDIGDFPRTDADYVAQLRKVTIDLALVPFGLDVPALLDPAADPAADPALRDIAIAVASGFGAAVIRTALPVPGEVPPRLFVETVAAAKTASRAAKAANVTVIVAAAPGTIGENFAAVKRLLKDVDSAWIRACPWAGDAGELTPRDRVPAFQATVADDPVDVVKAAGRSWLILDAVGAEGPWDVLRDAIAALRLAECGG